MTRFHFSPGKRVAEFMISMAALAGALRLSFIAGNFAEANAVYAHPEPDLLWRWLPVVDTHVVFVWGFGAFLAWLIIVSLWRERRRAAYIAWSYALLIALRSFFIILTPMHLPPEAVSVDQGFLFEKFGKFLTFRHDLFFSAHTAMPYLAFLILRGPKIRASFMAFSVVLACAVLLGRLHYSIDVFGAYFITYALHRAEARWFQPAYGVWRRKWFETAAQQ
jgi:hypothetical protein